MKLLFATAALAAVAVSAPAFAQTAAPSVTGYVNLGLAEVHSDEVDLGAVAARIGGRARYFGLEGEGAVGFTNDKYQGVKFRLKDEFAGYTVGFLPVANGNADLFARIGYGTTNLKGSFAGVSASGHSESVNYGIGAQYFFNGGPNGVRIDATRFDFTDDGGAANVYSVSYVRRFGGQ